LTDEDLMARARGGDAAAWETLTRQHQEAVFRLAYLILGDPADADDAAQETFIRAYRSLASFDPARPARPWLLAIAANQARNRLRSAGRYLAALQRWWLSGPAESDIAEPGQSGLLWQAVKRLNAADQEVLYLRYFSGLTEAETAGALGAPAGTVKSRTHRALARLRAVIEKEFPSLRDSVLDE
jgi:RNA polymerase sigma factor (sigma-70 family)